MITIPRFEVKDTDSRGKPSVGIKDHVTDKTVVLINIFEKKEDNVSVARDVISIIETHLQGEEDGGTD